MPHISVLLDKVIEKLDIQKGEIFVDATLGSAGHSFEICHRLGKEVKIVGIDQDPERIEEAGKKLNKGECNFKAIKGSFRNIDKILDDLGIEKVDKILYDLGLNSEQLENSGRGFSFQKDEPILMNYAPNPDITAREIVNEWSEESIRDIVSGYGEEKFARQIAKKIIERRREKSIESTRDLVEIIEKSVPNWYKHKRIHFATKTFQALRIAVNDELEALKESLQKSFKRLKGEGRIAVISFNGLEDRIVKNYFKELKSEGGAEILTKKPITANREEIEENPRSRSAKLRVIKKS